MSRLYGQGHNGVKAATNAGLPKTMLQRGYPGKYQVVTYQKSGEPVTGSGKQLKNHETYHKNLQENATGKIYGGFTTHPKAGETNYHPISQELLEGMPSTGGQWLGLYNNPKIIADSNILKQYPEYQKYVDKNEVLFNTIIKTKQETVCEERTSKQDSRFYNEDGTRDYENFPGKW